MHIRAYRISRLGMLARSRKGHRIGRLVALHHFLVDLHQFVGNNDRCSIDDLRPLAEPQLGEQRLFEFRHGLRIDDGGVGVHRLNNDLVIQCGGHKHYEHVEPRAHDRSQHCRVENIRGKRVRRCCCCWNVICLHFKFNLERKTTCDSVGNTF